MISGVLGSREPMYLEVMTHSESVHLCAELKTGILAVLTNTSSLGDSYIIADYHCYIMLNYCCFCYAHVNAIHNHHYN
jgi:hypothetical protein